MEDNMVLIIVNRNGARNNIGYARELAKHPAFRLVPLHDIIESIRSYSKTGDFSVSDCFITIKHYC